MGVLEFYNLIGGGYEDAKSRLVNDSLIERFILKYLDDNTFNELVEAINNHDIEASFQAVHTLKGVCGNLSFIKLYKATYDLTEQLRPLKNEADLNLFNKVKAAHEEVVLALRNYRN